MAGQQRAEPVLLALLALPLVFVYVARAVLYIPSAPVLRVFVGMLELGFVAAVLFHPRYAAGLPQRGRRAVWLAAAWLGWGWLAAGTAEVLAPALVRQAEWTGHLLFGLAGWLYLRVHPERLRAVLLLVPLGFYLAALALLAFWFGYPRPAQHDWFTGSPLFGHVRYVGYYALGAGLFCAAPLLGLRAHVGAPDRLTAFTGLAFCSGFLFWTGGRAAVGSMLFGLAVLVAATPHGQRWWTAGVAAAALGTGAWLSTLFRVADPRMGLFASLERTAAAGSANELATGRLSMWNATLDAIRAHPWFGLGPDGYLFLETKTYGLHPHNFILQAAAEWGLLGAALFGLLLIVMAWTALGRLRREADPLRRTARAVALALVVGFTAHSLVDGLFYHAVPLMLLALAFAMALLPDGPAGPARRLPAWVPCTAAVAVFLVLACYYLIFL